MFQLRFIHPKFLIAGVLPIFGGRSANKSAMVKIRAVLPEFFGHLRCSHPPQFSAPFQATPAIPRVLLPLAATVPAQ